MGFITDFSQNFKLIYSRSIRIPGGFVGIYGLRPSYGRVPYVGCLTASEGEESVPTVLGPLARSLSGVKIFMKVIAAAKPWDRDPLTVRKAWDSDAYSLADHGGEGGKNLVFAVMWDNGHIVPHPPVRRALEETKAALVAAGHKGHRRPLFSSHVNSNMHSCSH